MSTRSRRIVDEDEYYDPPQRRKKEKVSKDYYGFKLNLKAQQRQERQECSTSAEAALPSWSFVPQGGSWPGSNKLKKMIRKGIPPEYRGSVWMHISGAEDMQRSRPTSYFRGLASSESKSKALHQIELDLPRTFPGHKWVESEEGMLQLRHVLVAFSIHCKDVGYCQGLNFVAAILLLATDKDEESAFWLLVCLVENILLPKMFVETLEGCLIEMHALGVILSQKKPNLEKHMRSIDAGPEIFSTDWFLCLFCTVFPSETTTRVLDALFNEGSKILFRVSMALLKMNESMLLGCDNPGDIVASLKESALNMHNRDKLMKVAFDGIGSFPLSNIVKARQVAAVEVEAILREREAARRRQELKAKLESQRRRRDEEAERMMDDDIPDDDEEDGVQVLTQAAVQAGQVIQGGARHLTKGLGMVANTAKMAAWKLGDAAAAGFPSPDEQKRRQEAMEQQQRLQQQQRRREEEDDEEDDDDDIPSPVPQRRAGQQVQQNVVSKNLGKAVHKVEVAANQNIVGRAVIGTAGAVVGTAGTVVKGAGEVVVGTAGFVARGAGKAASRLRGYGPGGAEDEEASAVNGYGRDKQNGKPGRQGRQQEALFEEEEEDEEEEEAAQHRSRRGAAGRPSASQRKQQQGPSRTSAGTPSQQNRGAGRMRRGGAADEEEVEEEQDYQEEEGGGGVRTQDGSSGNVLTKGFGFVARGALQAVNRIGDVTTDGFKKIGDATTDGFKKLAGQGGANDDEEEEEEEDYSQRRPPSRQVRGGNTSSSGAASAATQNGAQQGRGGRSGGSSSKNSGEVPPNNGREAVRPRGRRQQAHYEDEEEEEEEEPEEVELTAKQRWLLAQQQRRR